MRYLVFLATIFVTLVCPFVCGRGGCGSSSKAVAADERKTCCGHCRHKTRDSQPAPERQGPCDSRECCCPCLCNGAILAEHVDVPAAIDSAILVMLPLATQQLARFEQVLDIVHPDKLMSSLSGHDRRVTFCSFTC